MENFKQFSNQESVAFLSKIKRQALYIGQMRHNGKLKKLLGELGKASAYAIHR